MFKKQQATYLFLLWCSIMMW